jgi:hypothetical protein
MSEFLGGGVQSVGLSIVADHLLSKYQRLLAPDVTATTTGNMDAARNVQDFSQTIFAEASLAVCSPAIHRAHHCSFPGAWLARRYPWLRGSQSGHREPLRAEHFLASWRMRRV